MPFCEIQKEVEKPYERFIFVSVCQVIQRIPGEDNSRSIGAHHTVEMVVSPLETKALRSRGSHVAAHDIAVASPTINLSPKRRGKKPMRFSSGTVVAVTTVSASVIGFLQFRP